MTTQLLSHPETCQPANGHGDFFLGRLARLVELRPESDLPFNAEQLLHHAIYSTFLDCRDLGLDHEANLLVASVK